ncbi:cytochrome b561 [Dictyocaulus viviparus]|uniref:Cytochrome b561 n=1 Tax=Dictyocaulus viviparus TaxID=29172 RepID=A0A0D8XRX9_DICVI|nr:cytochrome b561 [Dictyocaulus viviparus]
MENQKYASFKREKISSLPGYLFNTMDIGLKWPSKDDNGGINLHGMLMSIGFVFLQGEALLSYRLYRYDNDILSKCIHSVFHVLSLSFCITAFIVMILQRSYHGQNHFTTFHSWIGIAVIFLYIMQSLFGFINFLLSVISEEVRGNFLPLHQTLGSLLFTVSIVQAAIGYTRYNGIFNPISNNHNASLVSDQLKFVLNFTIISGILYGVSVLMLVVPDAWKRREIRTEVQ